MSKENLMELMELPYKIEITPIEDDGEKYFKASIPELPGLSVYEDTQDEALASLKDAKREWLTTALKRGINVPRPKHTTDSDFYSGRITIRIPKSMHKLIAENAKVENQSINSYIVNLLNLGIAYQSFSNIADEVLKNKVPKKFMNTSVPSNQLNIPKGAYALDDNKILQFKQYREPKEM